MANTISLTTSVGTDDTATIVDETTYTDPARGDVGVYLQIYKVSAAGVETELAVESDADDVVTDSQWTFDIAQDGHYRAYYVAIPEFIAGVYAEYDAVRDGGTNIVYRALQAVSGQTLDNTAYWEEIDEPALLAANLDTDEESANIDSFVYNDIILNQVTSLYGDKVLAEARECNCDCAECDDAQKMAKFVRVQREAALIAEIRQQYTDAEKCVRRLDELLED
jgi:hypothetical protein